MLRLKKILIVFCFFITVLIIAGLQTCNREDVSPHNFDIVTFFSDNEIPLDTNKILYSNILSIKKTPVVLASFLLSKGAWENFVISMNPYRLNNRFPAFSSDKDILPYGIPVYNYHLKGHMIYIYDIQPIDGDKNVVIKCLINLSL